MKKEKGTSEKMKEPDIVTALTKDISAKKDALLFVLDFARFLLCGGASFEILNGDSSQFLMRRIPETAANIRFLTRCDGNLPGTDAFRRNYTDVILRSGRFSPICNETKSCMGRAIINVLAQIQFRGKIFAFLIASRLLPPSVSANNTILRETIDFALKRLNLKWGNVLAFASDSGSYNVSMMNKLGASYPHVLHIRCVAHLLHNSVLEALSASPSLAEAAEFAANVSKMLRKSRDVRSRWERELVMRQRTKPSDLPKFVPNYYKTRWTALRTVASFSYEFLSGTVSFIVSLKGEMSDVQKKLQSICGPSCDSFFLYTMGAKLQALILELDEISRCSHELQRRETTFAELMVSIRKFQRGIAAHAAAGPMALLETLFGKIDYVQDPFGREFLGEVTSFRKKLKDSFENALDRNFYANGPLVSQLSEALQVYEPSSVTHGTCDWQDCENLANWWSKLPGQRPGTLSELESEFHHFKRNTYKAVADVVQFWFNRRASSLDTTAQMMLDVLPLPIGSSEAERSFSEQHRTDTKTAAQSSIEFAETKALLYQNRELEFDAAFADLRDRAFDTWLYGNPTYATRIPKPPGTQLFEEGLVVPKEWPAINRGVEEAPDEDDSSDDEGPEPVVLLESSGLDISNPK